MVKGFETYSQNGWKGLVSSEWRGRPDDLDKWLVENPGQRLVNRAGRVVSRVVVNGEELYVKVVTSLDDGEGGRCLLCLWKWFKWRFLGGRALRALEGTEAMRESGVFCAEAVLAVRRTHVFKAEEIFISRGVPYPSVMKIMTETTDAERRKDVLRGVAAGLCDFHCHGFLHGDCIPGNLLWDGEHVHFIDNDRTQLANGCLLQRGIRRNLVQFCFRMGWFMKDFGLAELFLQYYTEAMEARGKNFYGAEDVMEKARHRYEKKLREKGMN